MIYLLDSTKVTFILSHAYHAHVLLFLPYTVPSQSVLLGLRFIHNSVFSSHPPFVGYIHIITCLSCTCAPVFTVHCPFPVSSLRASVHSQQRFFLPPTLCSDWTLCLALLRLLLMFTIYLARPERISSRSLFHSPTSICILKINHLSYRVTLD